MWNLGTHYAVFLYSWNTLKNFVVYNEQAFGFYCIVNWQALEKRFHHFICHTQSENSPIQYNLLIWCPIFLTLLHKYSFYTFSKKFCILFCQQYRHVHLAKQETLAIDHSIVFTGQYFSIMFLLFAGHECFRISQLTFLYKYIFFFNEFTVKNCSITLKGCFGSRQVYCYTFGGVSVFPNKNIGTNRVNQNWNL